MASNERSIDRIRKLLRVKAAHERAAAEAGDEASRYNSLREAEAAATLLQELLTRHKLSPEDFAEETEEESRYKREPLNPLDYGAEIERERVRWTEDLAGYIGHAFFCVVLCDINSNVLWFAGRGMDVDIARTMFLRMARTALYLMQRDRGQKFSVRSLSPEELHAYLFSPIGEVSDTVYRDSYLTGFVRAVGERIIATRSRLEIEAGASQALVRAERDVALYADKEAGGRHTQDLPNAPELDYGALMQGMIRGKTVDIDAGGIPALTAGEETEE